MDTRMAAADARPYSCRASERFSNEVVCSLDCDAGEATIVAMPHRRWIDDAGH